MKVLKLNEWLNEKENSYFVPKNAKELRKIIEERIEKNGPECDLNDIDVSHVRDMSYLFEDLEDFNGDISQWDVSNVENMKGMFLGDRSFNGDISKWNVSKVENMSKMFHDAEMFDQPIGKWNVSKVKNMDYMFYGAKKFNQDISRWNIKEAYTKRMFYECPIRDEYKPRGIEE